MKASIDFNKVLQTIIAGLIIWVGCTVHKQEVQLSEVSIRLESLTKEVQSLRAEQFTAKDFQVSITPFDKRITKNEEDLKGITSLIIEIKDDLYIKGYLRKK